MSQSWLALAEKLIRAWVRLYTAGLALPTKNRRRLEIESDLWDQRQDVSNDGRSQRDFTAQILLRWLLGVPSDLAWRVTQVRERMPGRAGIKDAAIDITEAWKRFLSIGTILAAFYLFLGLGTLLGRDDPYGVVRLNGLIPVGFAALTAAGLWLCWMRPRIGVVLALLGAIPAAAMTVWSLFTPVLAAALLVLAVQFLRVAKELEAR